MYRPQAGQTVVAKDDKRWFIRAVRDAGAAEGFVVELIPSYRQGVWLGDESLELSSNEWCRWCELLSISMEPPDWSVVQG